MGQYETKPTVGLIWATKPPKKKSGVSWQIFLSEKSLHSVHAIVWELMEHICSSEMVIKTKTDQVTGETKKILVHCIRVVP